MKIVNVGSLNIDHVYSVAEFVRPGETIASKSYEKFVGGKGLNQSIALAKAGATVWHAGLVGSDGAMLQTALENASVDTRLVISKEGSSGHAMIQVDQHGQNSIILHGGTNQQVDATFIDDVVNNLEQGDILLLQNEINDIATLIKAAKAKAEIQVVLNPAPMTRVVESYPLELIDIFIINETEGESLTGTSDPKEILSVMQSRYPNAMIVLTLGEAGIRIVKEDYRFELPAQEVVAVDTTAAGDTFIGYFLAGLQKALSIEEAATMAVKASSICVTRKGAAPSIPMLSEVE